MSNTTQELLRRCPSCGKRYKVDFILPDTIWLDITHSSLNPLCGHCIVSRLEQSGAAKFGVLLLPESSAPEEDASLAAHRQGAERGGGDAPTDASAASNDAGLTAASSAAVGEARGDETSATNVEGLPQLCPSCSGTGRRSENEQCDDCCGTGGPDAESSGPSKQGEGKSRGEARLSSNGDVVLIPEGGPLSPRPGYRAASTGEAVLVAARTNALIDRELAAARQEEREKIVEQICEAVKVTNLSGGYQVWIGEGLVDEWNHERNAEAHAGRILAAIRAAALAAGMKESP